MIKQSNEEGGYMKVMKTTVLHIWNNRSDYFILFSMLLSIVSIITGANAIKTEQFDAPILAVVPISNLLWLLFTIFAKVPSREERNMRLKEAPENYNSGAYRVKRTLALCLLWSIFTVGLLIMLANFSMLVLLGVAAFVSKSGIFY